MSILGIYVEHGQQTEASSPLFPCSNGSESPTFSRSQHQNYKFLDFQNLPYNCHSREKCPLPNCQCLQSVFLSHHHRHIKTSIQQHVQDTKNLFVKRKCLTLLPTTSQSWSLKEPRKNKSGTSRKSKSKSSGKEIL